MRKLHFQNVIVPHSLDAASEAAVRTMLQITRPDTKIHLVHVLPPLAIVSGNLVATALLQKEMQEKAFEAMRANTRDSRVKFEVRFGRVADEIVKLASEREADLIAMPIQSKPVLRRLLGSVTERVLHQATCPVLVIDAATLEANSNL